MQVVMLRDLTCISIYLIFFEIGLPMNDDEKMPINEINVEIVM